MAIDAAVLRAKVEVAGVEQAQAQLRGFGAQLNTVGGQAKTASGGISAANASIGTAGANAGKATGGFKGLTSAIGGINPATVAAAAGVGSVMAVTQKAVGSAIAWESSLAGVAKTLDTTGLSAQQADAAVQQIGSDIRQMATEIPIAATELAGVAEAAGQLGIAREDVVAFTETMAKLGVATDLTAEQAATAIARIANITGLATEDVDNFGSALVDLGNNSAATESEILAMANRIAAAGNQAGLTEGEILGLSAALTSVGVRAEAGGTAITQVMNEIETSVESADERLATFAEIAGMSAEQFAEAWRTAPNEAIATFVEGLGNITAAGGSTVQVLDELGLDGIRVSQALNSAAGAGDLMRDSMDRGNRAMEENIALNQEAEQRFETTASQIQILKNNINELNLALAEGYLPAVNDSIGLTTAWVEEARVAGEIAVEFHDNIKNLQSAIGDYIPEIGTAGGRTLNFGTALREALINITPILGPLDAVNDLFGVFRNESEAATEATAEQRVAVIELTNAFRDNEDAFEGWISRIAAGSGPIAQMAQVFLSAMQADEAATDAFTVAIRENRDEFDQWLANIAAGGGPMAALAQQVLDAGFSFEQAATMQGDATRRMNMEFDSSVAAMDATTEQWGRRIEAMVDIFENAPEAASQVVDDLVLAFQSGRIDLDEIMALVGRMPEDAVYEHFLPALSDLRVDWQTTIAELGDAPEAEAGLRSLDTIMGALGQTFDSTAEKALNFGDVQDAFQLNIENASARVSEWQGHLSGAEEALGFLQEKIDAGIPLTEEQAAQYDTLTWAQERYKGGVEDESEALIDAEVAKANFIKIQDDLNAALENGEITQSEYNEAIGAAAAEMDPATAASMGLTDAQGALQETIDGTVEKLVKLMVELGILDETEAEAILGVDITEAESNVTHMEGRLQTYEETTAIARADVDDSGAVARIDGVEGELTAYAGATWTTTVDADVSAAEAEIARIKSIISSGAMLPVAISASENLSGYASGTGPGGTTKDQLAWVGERGPELAWLPEGTHILPNDESMKFAALLGSIPGFQDGTGGGGDRAGGRTRIDTDGFFDVGMTVGEAISAGIQLGLDLGILDNAAPTGEEIAAAMVDGAIRVIEAEGPDAVDSFVVNLERIPELAGQIGHDVVIGLLDEYAGLQGELQLAIISGDDTAEIQTRLDAIEALIVAWGGNAVEEVESVGDAIARALDVERFAGLFEMPGGAAPFDLEEIISGDALDEVRDEFQGIWDLQKIAQELGYDEFAAELGQQMAELGLQEQMLEDILGSDFAQQMAEQMEAEAAAQEFADRWERAMDAALGDNPGGFAEKVQSEIDDLQTKIDLAPANIPAEIIAGWQEELDSLQGDQEAFWGALAESAAAGLLDPEVLAGLDEAGRAQLQAYLEPLVGEEGAQQIIDGIGAVTQITADGLAQLTQIFAEDGEAAAGHIDDLVQAALDGSMTWADAMALMGNVPRDELIPTLEDLERKFREDLVQAILAGDAAAEQIAENGLAKVADALANVNSELTALDTWGTRAGSISGGAVSHGGGSSASRGSSTGGRSGSSSSGGRSGQVTPIDLTGGGPESTWRDGLVDLGGTLGEFYKGDMGDSLIFVPEGAAGYMQDRTLMLRFLDDPIDQRLRYLDRAEERGIDRFYLNPEGLSGVRAGGPNAASDFLLGDLSDFDLRRFSPGGIPRFADGGVALGPSLAILGDNPSGREMVLPFERNQEFARSIAQELAVTLRATGMGGGGDVYLDGQKVGHILSGHINSMARSHVTQSGIPVGLGRR